MKVVKSPKEVKCGVRRGCESGRVSKMKMKNIPETNNEPKNFDNCLNAKDEESAEVKQYLDKLKELVPFMPKNRRLSKLEVISNVIDYIHDLNEILGFPSCGMEGSESCISSDEEPGTTTTTTQYDEHEFEYQNKDQIKAPFPHHQLQHPQNRQPLCVISSPNGNVNQISEKPEAYSEVLVKTGVPLERTE